MGFTWTAATNSVTGLDGRTHHRARHPGQPLRAGLVPVLCGHVVTTFALIAPVGADCPDCIAVHRAAADPARPANLRGAARRHRTRTTRTAPPR